MGKLCVTPLVGSLSQPRGASLGQGWRVASVAIFSKFLSIPSQPFEIGAFVLQQKVNRPFIFKNSNPYDPSTLL